MRESISVKNSSTILLGVNIDHTATVRQARYRDYAETFGKIVEPDPLQMAITTEQGGADGITLHLREDRRHIQDADVTRVREAIKTRLNLEMACTQEMIDIALKIKPEFVCLVPESREEVTTEGGLDVIGQATRVAEVISAMSSAGIKTSLFIDPEKAQIEKAAELKAPFIELHTGAFANNYYNDTRDAEFAKLVESAELAHELGITVNAGHGINYTNIEQVRTLPHLYELNIGHSIISRALLIGLENATREMKNLMNPNNQTSGKSLS